ncbi:MAG: hypothetical protein ACKV2V_30060 [Blastocatellia bacterium]
MQTGNIVDVFFKRSLRKTVARGYRPELRRETGYPSRAGLKTIGGLLALAAGEVKIFT